MRKPNVERWCAKFVVSLIKNLPNVETFVDLDDVFRIATGYVRRTVDAIRIESEKKKKGGDPNEEAREEAGREAGGEEAREEVRRQVQEVSG